MIELRNRPLSLVANFELLKPLLERIGPESIHALRAKSMKAFEAVGLPTRRDEEFKYLPLHVLAETSFGPAYGATVERADLVGAPLANFDAATIAFVNGEPSPDIDVPYSLPDGVELASLRDALEAGDLRAIQRLQTIATLDGKLGGTNDSRFANLNAAFIADGAFVYVPAGVDLQTPIHLRFLAKADHTPFASHPRIVIVLGAGAKAKIVESYVGLQGTYFNNAVTEIALGEGAHLEHIRLQAETESAIHIAKIAVSQESDSEYAGTTATFGAAVSRNDVDVWVGGERCETWLNGTYVGDGEQLLDNHTRIDHAKPNCKSFEVYKGILAGKATGVFNGKIFVYEDAQKTDAKQTNQAILLSPTATVNTKPQLEIFADDVKCTHGATVGRLSLDALFYMRARGIPEIDARSMLVLAFAAEAYQRVHIESVRTELERMLADKLRRRE